MPNRARIIMRFIVVDYINSLPCKRALARLVEARSWEPTAREFDSWLAPKNSSRLSHIQSIVGGPTFLTSDEPLCTGGVGIWGFSQRV